VAVQQFSETFVGNEMGSVEFKIWFLLKIGNEDDRTTRICCRKVKGNPV